jgi:hypothetical protein
MPTSPRTASCSRRAKKALHGKLKRTTLKTVTRRRFSLATSYVIDGVIGGAGGQAGVEID